MKSVVLILVALTMLFKPFWPVVDYAANYDYIIKVLCENKDKPELKCNGKCYLSKQLAKEAQESEDMPFNSQDKIEIPVVLFCQSEENYEVSQLLITQTQQNYNNTQNCYSKLFCDITSPPPKIL
ncbi:hypothetical protein [Winogradskyella jejuensis]|uniref:Uncharacterized protein n=1 Tax=Winogradskyella jejuensis TaxID=1089305 RepID=A0A1M5KSL6_9FLAO|nr:hypothetical protein [Winogradskyella jejuensis]SHG55519.1 hypothetical protein SAMN05444148_0416 [Winogradskyella jejuensis]